MCVSTRRCHLIGNRESCWPLSWAARQGSPEEHAAVVAVAVAAAVAALHTQNPRRFPCFSECVFFEKSTTDFGSYRVSKEK